MPTAFESRVTKYLESMGFTVHGVTNMHFVADLIAFSESSRTLLIRCRENMKLDKEQSNKLFRVARQNNVVPVYITQNRRKRLNIETIKEMK
ncbi:unnamed protein product [marine sediment metagenome]|uniref:DUF5615 domain-containing protein n=1 Tax=marine sediment metagenome TaxID=412755 RepID=X0W4H7_9ZZZZ